MGRKPKASEEKPETEVKAVPVMGRPRKYDQAYLDVLNDHLKTWVAKKYALFKRTGVGEIWLGDFAFEEGFSRNTLCNLADPKGEYRDFNQDFAETYAWAKTAQESWAIFDEKISYNIRKLMLVNHHQYQDKVEIQTTTDPAALPAAFTTQFNFYLQQMGVPPLALPTEEAEFTEVPKDKPAGFTRDFKSFLSDPE